MAKLAARSTSTHSPDKKGPAAEATPARAAAERRKRSRSPRSPAIAHACSHHRKQEKNPPPEAATLRSLSAGLLEGSGLEDVELGSLPELGRRRWRWNAARDVEAARRRLRFVSFGGVFTFLPL